MAQGSVEFGTLYDNPQQHTLRSQRPAATSNWYAALSRAMGQQLDGQAGRVMNLALNLEQSPSAGAVLQVQTEASVMQVLSGSAANVNKSIGEALETLGRR